MVHQVRSGCKTELDISDEVLNKYKTAARCAWRQHNMQPLINFLSEYFKVPAPNVRIQPKDMNIAYYNVKDNTIIIKNESVVTLTRVFYEYARRELKTVINVKSCAHTFAVSIYAKAFPRLYKKMVEEKRLSYW